MSILTVSLRRPILPGMKPGPFAEKAGRQLAPIVVVALFAAFLPHARAETETIDLKALAKKARPAVMLLVVSDATGKEIATGTGFLVSSDGKLITNHHVIENAGSAIAKAENGGRFAVTGVLADDPTNDLVLLKLDGKDLPFLALGNSDKIEVGTRIAVIGSPLGLEGTLSEGIVSAVRDLMSDIQLLQITAAISPGSSGSPVLDAKGEVIGVARALLQEGQALNFAVPAGSARALVASGQNAMAVQPLSAQTTSNSDRIFGDPDWSAAAAAQVVGNYVDLLKHAQPLVRRYPENPYAHNFLGCAYLELHFLPEAVAAYKESIKLKPDNVWPWLGLGRAYEEAGRRDEAIAAFEQAIKLEPAYSWAWSLLGNRYSEAGRMDAAIAAYRKALKLNPDDEESWNNLGVAYDKAGRRDDAIAACRQAIKLKPDYVLAWYNLGGFYEGTGRRNDAILSLRQAVKLKPDYAAAWHNLGVVCDKAGRKDEASDAFQRAKNLDSELFK